MAAPWPWNTDKKPYLLSNDQAAWLQALVMYEIEDIEMDIEDAKNLLTIYHHGPRRSELQSTISADESKLDFMRSLYKDIGGQLVS